MSLIVCSRGGEVLVTVISPEADPMGLALKVTEVLRNSIPQEYEVTEALRYGNDEMLGMDVLA